MSFLQSNPDISQRMIEFRMDDNALAIASSRFEKATDPGRILGKNRMFSLGRGAEKQKKHDRLLSGARMDYIRAVVPIDDREITDQYRRLYGTVHTWSHNFLPPPPSLPTLTDAEDQLVRSVVLVDRLDPILSNNSLRRSVLEGLVGNQISIMLSGSSMSPVH